VFVMRLVKWIRLWMSSISGLPVKSIIIDNFVDCVMFNVANS